MPISGTGPILGLTLATASLAPTPPGIAAWTGVASALCSWIPANSTVLPGTMVAVGAAVTGFGALLFSAANTLGPALAAGAGSTDAAGIARWIAIGNAIASHLTTFGQVVPSAFVVSNPVTGGPVVGTGLVQVSNPALGPSLAAAASSIDAPGIAAWASIGFAITAHLVNAQALATPIGFVAPPGGGPLVGSGTII